MQKNILVLVGLSGLVLGCSHYPAPTQQVASSMAAVRAAEEAGAQDVPQAALHVKLAQEQLQSAQELMQKEKNKEAERKARRADSDAELAVTLAHEQAAQSKLQQFSQSNNAAGGEAMPPQAGQGTAP